MMVQYVIDCLSRNTAPPWLESADPAVSFTFAGGEKAHSETRIWLPLPGTSHERFAVQIVPSEVTPILLGLDILRKGVWFKPPLKPKGVWFKPPF